MLVRRSRRPFTCAALATILACATPAPQEPPVGDGSTGPPRQQTDRTVAMTSPPEWQLDWARNAVFYEIFVRSFADSDGDGVGDFRGLTARLDYLNDGDPTTDTDLGVDALWLMPIFESPSYHGYDTVDYYAVDAEYGTAEDFATFLAAAHRRGLRVIIDLMVNHTSSAHPWFASARTGPDAPRRDWYVWRRDDPGWTQPWGGGPTWHRNPADGWFYYGIFWSGMPDLDFRNPAVRREVREIATYWLERGVDGFRLDAARHIVADGPGQAQNDSPETHAWWRELAGHVHAVAPGALLVGEAWADAVTIAPYFSELPMAFNFPLAGGVVEAVRSASAAPVAAALRAMAAEYPRGALPAHFLTNHDMVRIATQAGGDPAKLRLAAALFLTLPGTPFLYYGEEVGLANGPGGRDEEKRTPMPWSDAGAGGGFTDGEPWHPFAPGRAIANVAAQTGDPASLLSRYRTLVRLRRDSPALAHGTWRLLAGDSGPLLVLLREADAERVLVAHDVGMEGSEAKLALAASGADLLWSDPGAELTAPADAAGQDWKLTLPPGGSAVWLLR